MDYHHHARLTVHGREQMCRSVLEGSTDLVPRPPVVRYEHEQPGDLLHLDIKGMTRFGEVMVRGDGRLRGKRKHPGFCALHIAIVLSLP